MQLCEKSFFFLLIWYLKVKIVKTFVDNAASTAALVHGLFWLLCGDGGGSLNTLKCESKGFLPSNLESDLLKM